MVSIGCGPEGYPDTDEAENTGLHPKILAMSVRNMLKIYDEKMSGTVFGTVLLIVALETTDAGSLVVGKMVI